MGKMMKSIKIVTMVMKQVMRILLNSDYLQIKMNIIQQRLIIIDLLSHLVKKQEIIQIELMKKVVTILIIILIIALFMVLGLMFLLVIIQEFITIIIIIINLTYH